MAFNNNWHKKKRLHEQLKFFGAKKTRFISCYAKKPRIKIELPYKCRETGAVHHPDGTCEIDYTESRVRYLKEKLRQTIQQKKMDALCQPIQPRYDDDLLQAAMQSQALRGMATVQISPLGFQNDVSCVASSLWGGTI